MAYRAGRNYLFCEGDLGDVLRAHVAKIHEKIDAIPESQFLTTPNEALLRDLEAELRVAPIELDEASPDRSMTKEEINLDVSGDPRRVIFPGGRPVYVPAIRVRVSIPFRGEPGLWKLRPSTWRTTFPNGITRISGANSGFLEIIIEQPADEPTEEIKQRFDRILDDVRFYLQHQRTQINAENEKLSVQIKMAIDERRERLKKHDTLPDLLGIPLHPSSIPRTIEMTSRPTAVAAVPRLKGAHTQTQIEWDVFVSHASEDKEAFVRPLAKALHTRGLRVWFDEFTLQIGDSLRRSIDRGLSASAYGIVVISPAFLEKEWPQKELDGLVAKEIDGRKVILPVWHNVDVDTVRRYSPTLCDRLATSSAKGINRVVDELLAAIQDH